MSRSVIAIAVVMIASAFSPLSLPHSLAADGPTAAETEKDKAKVKACLDLVEAKLAEDEALRQQQEAKETPGATVPNDKNGAKAGAQAYLEAAAQSKPRFTYDDCIGIVADDCLKSDEAQSTYGMMDCFARENEVWDARLNAAYREAMAPQTDPGLDKASQEIVTQQLRKVQSAWIPWRDATCEVLYADGIPIYGSESKIEGVHCTMMLTARQALWLEGKSALSYDR